jgi:hypothetical protein
MKIIIGYHQRSGSTLLQHIINEHSEIHSYSDANSLLFLPSLLSGYNPAENVCIKPLDLFFLIKNEGFYRKFDKFIWLARDPRDSYLSAFEVKFAYNFWFPGKKIRGIDVGLIKRWRLVYKRYFENRKRWHLIRYEDLVSRPKSIIRKLFRYLEVPYEDVLSFPKHNILSGGDPKLRKTDSIHKKSIFRYRRQMPKSQQMVFRMLLKDEMTQLGYL